MNNFFDNLKNNLENRTQPEFEESAWMAMQKKMQAEESPRRRAAGWWWLSWLIIPLILSNGWMYVRMENAEALLEKTEYQRDTVFQTQVIYHTDTIYLTQKIQAPIANATTGYSKNKNSKTILLQNSFFDKNRFEKSFQESDLAFLNHPIFKDRNSQNTWSSISNFRNNNTLTKDKTTTSTSASENSPFLTSLDFSFLKTNNNHLQLLDLQAVTILEKEKKWKKRWRNVTNTLRPKGFQLGIGGGYFYPLNEDLEKRKGDFISVNGSVHFSDNLRLWMEFGRAELHLKTNELSDAFGIPTIPSPDVDFIFDKAVGDLPLLQFGVGMQYFFQPKKRLRPFLGAGFSAAAFQPYEIEYEFFDPNQNLELIVSKNISTQNAVSNLWILNAGLEFQIYKKWSGQLEGYYRGSWENEANPIPNMLGFQTRLMYKF